MTTPNETGGPAFPIFPDSSAAHAAAHKGLTMRDYFAAKAMQGFAVDDNATWQDGLAGLARAAYSWADAMLEARK